MLQIRPGRCTPVSRPRGIAGVVHTRWGDAPLFSAQRPQFARTRFRPGYSVRQVDAFFDRIEGTLGLRPLTKAPVTFWDVANARFRIVRIRSGYDIKEVDDALDDYRELLGRADGK
jgi:DivIVA domain-containing protein